MLELQNSLDGEDRIRQSPVARLLKRQGVSVCGLVPVRCARGNVTCDCEGLCLVSTVVAAPGVGRRVRAAETRTRCPCSRGGGYQEPDSNGRETR